MAIVEYDPFVVADPTTKAPRTDLWGAKLTAVFHDTNIPVPNLLEGGSKQPLANPFSVSAIGFTPSIAIENGPVRIDYVTADGNFRTPVTSFSGAQARMDESAASAAASAAAAAEAIELADVVDLIAGLGITLTPTAAGVVIAAPGVGGGGGAPASHTHVPNDLVVAAFVKTFLAAANAAAARSAIGAGTSNVAIGTVPGTAQEATKSVLLAGDQTIDGTKVFLDAPSVPVDSFPPATVVGLADFMANGGGGQGTGTQENGVGFVRYNQSTGTTGATAVRPDYGLVMWLGFPDNDQPVAFLDGDFLGLVV